MSKFSLKIRKHELLGKRIITFIFQILLIVFVNEVLFNLCFWLFIKILIEIIVIIIQIIVIVKSIFYLFIFLQDFCLIEKIFLGFFILFNFFYFFRIFYLHYLHHVFHFWDFFIVFYFIIIIFNLNVLVIPFLRLRNLVFHRSRKFLRF